MAGIAGFAGFSYSKDLISKVITHMGNELTHLEPGTSLEVYIEQAAGLGFADWQEAEGSNMDGGNHVSEPDEHVVAYSGAIYNLHQISHRMESERVHLRGTRNKDILSAAIRTWGLKSTLEQINGAFAMSVWDRKNHTLQLARDRIGKKSLYYGWTDNSFVFASELKALQVYPEFRPKINRDAVALLLRYGYIPAPYSIYTGVFKLPPGSTLTLYQHMPHERPNPVSYWCLRDVVESGDSQPLGVTLEEAVEHCHCLLLEATRMRMANASFGVFLSSGVDSSTVASLAQTVSSQPIKTFTIGFDDKKYNEANQAKSIAEYLGTDHTELYVWPKQAMSMIRHFPSLYDEPFADSSQIPTSIVSALASKQVDMVLSGDGGDELFAGYNRYVWGSAIWNRIGGWPRNLRITMSKAIQGVSPRCWEWFFSSIGSALSKKFKISNPAAKIYKLARALDASTPEDMYYRLISQWDAPESILVAGCEPSTQVTDCESWPQTNDITRRMMYLDTLTYLPDDILVKVDRAAVGAGLEVRSPILDYQIVEFAWRLPLSVHMYGGKGKWILRQILEKYVPKELTDGSKMGFGFPLGDWLRGPLRDWGEALLDRSRLEYEGIFRAEPVRRMWTEHLSGRFDWEHHLWIVLMFQSWFETNGRSHQTSIASNEQPSRCLSVKVGTRNHAGTLGNSNESR